MIHKEDIMEAIIQVNRLTKTYAKHSRGVIELDMTIHKEISMVSLVQMVQANRQPLEPSSATSNQLKEMHPSLD